MCVGGGGLLDDLHYSEQLFPLGWSEMQDRPQIRDMITGAYRATANTATRHECDEVIETCLYTELHEHFLFLSAGLRMRSRWLCVLSIMLCVR